MTTLSFIDSMQSLGYRCAVVPLSRLDDLEDELRELGESEFASGFIGWRAQGLDKYRPKDLPFTPRSMAIIAQTSPASHVRIDAGDRPLDVLVPPTYADADRFEAACARDAAALLAPDGLHAAPADGLPYKLLAVRSGLGRYGRNNICYVYGLGSYTNLFSLYLDLPCDADPWRDARRLDACQNCTACVAACPTQAIDPKRTVIDAERCLCWLNERPDPFPDWLDPNAHHTLVGCLRCQTCCPANAAQRDNIADVGTLTRAEADQILALPPDAPFPDALQPKAAAIGMGNYTGEGRFQRNLKALLQARTRS